MKTREEVIATLKGLKMVYAECVEKNDEDGWTTASLFTRACLWFIDAQEDVPDETTASAGLDSAMNLGTMLEALGR